MEGLNEAIAGHLSGWVHTDYIGLGTRAVILLGIIVVSYAITKLFRHIVMPAIQKITTHTKATWDDYLFNDKMLSYFCQLIPPIIWYMLLPLVFEEEEARLLHILLNICQVYIIVVILRLISTFLNILYEISNENERLRNRPLKGIYQMVNILSIGVGTILIISILIDKNASSILAGLGASAAILMLVFKDSILGLVAGVQLSANDMLRPGDWITMNKYGVDGTVSEVSLTTVKVKNFDNTIVTIPPYSLVSDSFQNWRGMQESGGRRVKRTLNIDMRTIRFCTSEELERFVRKGWISDEESRKRPIVNMEIFLRYLYSYMKQHPGIRDDMTQLVRQMQPTPEGMPVEIYCFGTTVWLDYEALQAEIFNHVIAILPEFGLQIFQRPAGTDFAQKQ